jgi:hypothetical protein
MITPKKPPYSSSKTDPDRTQMEINKLLQQYGVSGIQWTTDFQHNKVSLGFTVETEFDGVKRLVGIKFEPQPFAVKRKTWNPKGYYETVWAANWGQTFRMLYWQLKAKLEAVSYGLTSVEKEFLSQVMVNLPSGEQSTIGEALQAGALSGKLQLTDRSQEVSQV